MTNTQKITYWVSTLWLALGMVSTGLAQLFKFGDGPGTAASMVRLGYPVSLMALLGIWKLLGVVAILVPKNPLVKEWAYAGFFFIMTGALYAHIAAGDPAAELFPALLLLVLTTISWFTRPADKRFTATTQERS